MDDPNDPFCDGIRWLSVEDLLWLNKRLIERYTPAETPGAHSQSLLESAQLRPATWAFHSQNHDMACIGAMVLIAIVSNHPFHNANKRTAFAACRMLLFMNGYLFDPPYEEAMEVMVEIAKGTNPDFRDPEYLGSWVADHTKQAADEQLPLEAAQAHAMKSGGDR